MKIFYLILIIFIFLIKSITSVDNVNEDGERILSRPRRYLTFPEGSSLQLVYDQTIPILAAVLHFTIGVTSALAWELPSKPLYKITQELKEKLKTGELWAQKKDNNVTKLTYVDSNSTKIDNWYDVNKHNYYYSSPTRYTGNYNSNNNLFNTGSGNQYYSTKLSSVDSNGNKNNYYKPTSSNKFDYYTNNYLSNKSGNDFNYYADKLKQISNGGKWTKSDWVELIQRMTSKNKKSNAYTKNRPHTVYPLFGKKKRDIVKEEKIENIFFLEHHRSTRHVLYKNIETYLSSKGLDGEACLLKTLCETKQKENEERGTFVAEIIRAIFTLPSPNEEVRNVNHQNYDKAYTDPRNCTEQFPDCTESVYKSDFIF